MFTKRGIARAAGLVVAIGAVWLTQWHLENRLDAQSMQAPQFQVDPFWPKPLPNAWLLGSTIGAWVDANDVIWIIHRGNLTGGEAGAVGPDASAECCRPAPPVLAFDRDGNVVRAWGPEAGAPYQGAEWPTSNHGIFVDHEGYVWIGGNGGGDSHIIKLTQDGNVVRQYGHAEARADGQGGYQRGSLDTESFGRVAKIFVDEVTNEVYLADGYFNRRVAVLNQETGVVDRMWGAYGNRPDDNYQHPPNGGVSQQFRGPVHCADVSVDRLVYVCDRGSARMQVFTTEGEFVKEGFFGNIGASTWDIAFSKDPEQTYIFVPDGTNQRVRVIERESLTELTNFGQGGRYPGEFFGAHSIAIDSDGNLYTTETYEGKRVQKFVYRGLAAIPADYQGTVWPQ